jgi:hypothetical protein
MPPSKASLPPVPVTCGPETTCLKLVLLPGPHALSQRVSGSLMHSVFESVYERSVMKWVCERAGQRRWLAGLEPSCYNTQWLPHIM